MADAGPWSKYTVSAPEPQQADSGPWTQYAAAPSQWDAGTEAMNAAMLGYGPAINGLLGGNAAADRSAHQAFDAAHPYQALGANVVGGAVPAVAMTAAGLPPVAAGMIQGGANGYAEQGMPGAVMGGAVGGLGAGVLQGLGALGRAVGVLPKAAPTAAVAPTQQALADTGGNQFNALRASGETFPAPDVRAAATDAGADLRGRGLTGGPMGTAPKANAVLSDLRSLAPAPQTNPMQAMTGVAPSAPAPVSVTDLDAVRKAAGNVRGPSVDPSDQHGAGIVGNRILDLYATNPAVAALSEAARGNTSAAFRSQDLQNIIQNAENRGISTGSGMNTGNSMRGRVATFIDPSQNRAEGFTPAEMAGLQKVVNGSLGQNLARTFGNVLGGGQGLGGATVGIAGAHALGPIGAAIPFIGTGLKAFDNAAAGRALRAVDEATRLRSPLGQQAVANFTPPSPMIAPGAVPATLGGLLGAYMTGQGQ